MVEKSTWFPRTFFDVISLVEKSTWFPRTFFDVISMVEKSTLFPRTFFDVISMVENPRCFYLLFWLNLDGRKMHFVCTYFCRRNFDEIDVVFGKLYANKNIQRGFSFVSNFKKLSLARLFSLNFLSKSPWCSTTREIYLKFESYNLQHCKKNCCKLVFWVFT